MTTAREAMRRAVELAAEGALRVEPNPPVGCVILKHGRIVGEGFHRYWGGPHAEAAALRRAGAAAQGATVCVTLEPCAHRGKTPPCSKALLRAGISELVYAHEDPNPLVAGKGLAELREAGVRVRKLPPSRRLKEILEPYRTHVGRRRPWVIAKWAMTLDGRIATRSGDSRWITSEEARNWAHKTFRSRVDAIAVGARTVRSDDPELTNRSGRGGTPLRVVVCGRRFLPRHARVLNRDAPTLLAAPPRFRAPAHQHGVEVLRCGRSGRVDVDGLLKKLYQRGVRRLLVEGGGELLGSLFDKKLVDQAVAFVSPKIVGGVSAVSPVAGRGSGTMEQAAHLTGVRYERFGPDCLLEGYVTTPAVGARGF